MCVASGSLVVSSGWRGPVSGSAAGTALRRLRLNDHRSCRAGAFLVFLTVADMDLEALRAELNRLREVLLADVGAAVPAIATPRDGKLAGADHPTTALWKFLHR